MAVTISLDAETRAILAQMSVRDCVAVLPEGQLARPVYEKVNKALAMLGGKWNKQKRGHVFPSDPTALLQGAEASGAVENLKQKYQFFETPADLAFNMVGRLRLQPGERVLEPSAGRGRLVDPCGRAGAHVTAIEIWDANIPYLEKLLPTSNVIAADFLNTGSFDGVGMDAVAMNPPFSNKQAVRHIRHAWGWLRDGGRMVAICDGGALVNQSAVERDFQKWLREIGAEVEQLAAGTFAESGTGVASHLIYAEKAASRESKGADTSAEQ